MTTVTVTSQGDEISSGRRSEATHPLGTHTGATLQWGFRVRATLTQPTVRSIITRKYYCHSLLLLIPPLPPLVAEPPRRQDGNEIPATSAASLLSLPVGMSPPAFLIGGCLEPHLSASTSRRIINRGEVTSESSGSSLILPISSGAIINHSSTLI